MQLNNSKMLDFTHQLNYDLLFSNSLHLTVQSLVVLLFSGVMVKINNKTINNILVSL